MSEYFDSQTFAKTGEILERLQKMERTIDAIAEKVGVEKPEPRNVGKARFVRNPNPTGQWQN